MSKARVFIIYGFAEGPWHGRLFRQELVKAGFEPVDNTDNADIIIAHSGGCFYLPEPPKEKLTVLINPPYWPGKPLIKSAFQNAWHNFAVLGQNNLPTSFWLKKTAWNAIYLLMSFRKTVLIALNARRRNFYMALKKRRTLLVRSEHDVWLAPEANRLLKPYVKVEFYQVPGWHDHCWLEPKSYVKVIQSVYDP